MISKRLNQAYLP